MCKNMGGKAVTEDGGYCEILTNKILEDDKRLPSHLGRLESHHVQNAAILRA